MTKQDKENVIRNLVASGCVAFCMGEYTDDFTRGIGTAIKIVDSMEPDEPGWIPVTEALPTTDDKVLCCTMTKKGVPNIVIGYYLHGEHGCSWACGMNSNVVAWMTLPEPYEGGES